MYQTIFMWLEICLYITPIAKNQWTNISDT